MPILFPLLLSALLFGVGLYGVLARRNAVLSLIGVEIMLNAVTLQLVTYDVAMPRDDHTGQTFALFIIVIAAAEVGLGLAIVLALFGARGTVDVDDVERVSS